MTARCLLAVAWVALALAPREGAAADITILDRPGAVHRETPPSASPAQPGFSLIPPAQAASRGPSGSAATVPALRLTGVIEVGDAAKLEQAIGRLSRSTAIRPDTPLTAIELSSMGGSLFDGIAIGRLLKKHRMVAVVRQRDFCLSSCALAFLGGNEPDVPTAYPTRCNLELGAKVAFHNFFLNPQLLRPTTATDAVESRLQGFSDARGGAASLVRYAADLGLPPSFAASLMGRPIDDFQYIETVGQFLKFGVCPIGLARPSVALEQQALNACRNSTDEDAPAQLQARLLPAQYVKRYLLERVQATMQASRARGRLAGLLASGAVMRVPEEIDRLYEDLRAAGMALPDIVGPTYEILGEERGSLQVTCYVSLSPDDSEIFDVVVSSERGLAFPPRDPPDKARKLFLYDRNTIINPRPR
ncbi:MAG: hypothetical protein KIT25_15505 [Enhydrobacter sp.]|nr:MAG: hypothetical protein KIT25_15505 [Enhydrobacter sp.]